MDGKPANYQELAGYPAVSRAKSFKEARSTDASIEFNVCVQQGDAPGPDGANPKEEIKFLQP
jgi:hypothetical protein